MKFCYADPPYLGCGSKHYKHQHDEAAEWDKIETHRDLILRLSDEFPDGWVMSLSSPSLHQILPLCPPDVRIGAWVKPFCSFKPGVTVAYAWEPVIIRGGRKRPRTMPTVRDFVSANIMLKKGCAGAKPEAFCFWLFEVLNIERGDEFIDMFYGSGIVTESFKKWMSEKEVVK